MAAATDMGLLDIATGILLLLIVIPLLGFQVRQRLPSRCMRTLQAALTTTDGLYDYCLESGLMTEATATSARNQLLALHARAGVLNLHVSQAVTVGDHLKNMRRGLASEIDSVRRQVDVLRAQISSVSLDELEAQLHPQYQEYDADVKMMPNQSDALVAKTPSAGGVDEK